VLIGVADNRSITPLGDLNRALSQAQDVARNCDPPVMVRVTQVAGVLVVEVPASRNKPHSSKGMFYLREGASTQKMSREQLRDFFFSEGLLYFDAMPAERFSYPADLSDISWKDFSRAARLPEGLERDQVLRNLGLLSEGRLCNAGVLALGRPVTRFLASAKIICTVFQGKGKTTILDQKVYEDDILSNFQSALLYLKAHLNTRFIITGERTEQLELPEVALREAVLNAIAHRDYRSSAAVQIQIFEDRVEVLNPGGLVGGMTLEDLGTVSAPRNPVLFGLMYRLSLVEQVGSGFKRMQAAVREAGQSGPDVRADRSWFSLTFRRPGDSSLIATDAEPLSIDRTTQETTQETTQDTTQETLAMRERVLSLLRGDPDLTRVQLADRLGISPDGVKYHLDKLRAAGLLRHNGPTKGGWWEVAERPKKN